MKDVQLELRKLAVKNGLKINLFNGWTVTDKDGSVYMVSTAKELHALTDNLIKQSDKENVTF